MGLNMAINYDKKGYVIHDQLNEEQARVFIGFLEQEKARHQEDIDKIDRTLTFLKYKFN